MEKSAASKFGSGLRVKRNGYLGNNLLHSHVSFTAQFRRNGFQDFNLHWVNAFEIRLPVLFEHIPCCHIAVVCPHDVGAGEVISSPKFEF